MLNDYCNLRVLDYTTGEVAAVPLERTGTSNMRRGTLKLLWIQLKKKELKIGERKTVLTDRDRGIRQSKYHGHHKSCVLQYVGSENAKIGEGCKIFTLYPYFKRYNTCIINALKH